MKRFGGKIFIALSLLLALSHVLVCQAASLPQPFAAGLTAYRSGDYSQAAKLFRDLSARQVSSGALQNLGNAEWQCGEVGSAVLAWEQALWLNPFDANARNNLRFAREAVQIESPDLTWYEVASSWLPTHWWAWLAGISLWMAVGALVLPGVLRWRKSAWQQALAALSFGVFLVCIPAHIGTLTRTNRGFVLEKDTPLRLTPTAGADLVSRLAAGEPARKVRARGNYIYVRTRHAAGWLVKEQLGLISERPK